MSSRYNYMCGCEYCIYTKSILSLLLSWRDSYLKNSRIKAKMVKTESLGENKITYMILIKIRSYHMGVIFTPNHMIWQRQQCLHTQSQIMHCHTGNVYCNFVPNFLALIFMTKKQMIIIPTLVLQLVFTFIIWLHVVQNTWQASVNWQEKLL